MFYEDNSMKISEKLYQNPLKTKDAWYKHPLKKKKKEKTSQNLSGWKNQWEL